MNAVFEQLPGKRSSDLSARFDENGPSSAIGWKVGFRSKGNRVGSVFDVIVQTGNWRRRAIPYMPAEMRTRTAVTIRATGNPPKRSTIMPNSWNSRSSFQSLGTWLQ